MRVCAVALLLWAMAAHAQWRELTWVDPSLRWRTLETPHFAVHFAEQRRGEARLVAGVAEAVYPRVTGMLDWRPQETFESGLEKTVHWYLHNENWWRPIRERRYRGERLGVAV